MTGACTWLCCALDSDAAANVEGTGGTVAANPYECDKLDQSMQGHPMSRQPYASIQNRSAAVTATSGNAQFLAPFHRPVQNLELMNDVGEQSNTVLHGGAHATNPHLIASSCTATGLLGSVCLFCL